MAQKPQLKRTNVGHEHMPHEFDGDRYAKASSHQKEWGARLIDDLHLTGSEHVLDLGCGDGALTARIAELVPTGRVVGVDASRGMVGTARAHALTNLHFLLMDIDSLDFDGAFDVVFSNAALHWVKDHHLLYRNVLRALREGGRVRFDFAGKGNCAGFFTVVRETMTLEPFAPAFATFEWPWYMPDVEAYASLVGAAGFREARVWGESADRFFPNVDAMIAWIDQPSIVPFLEHLPAGLRPGFRGRVVEGMIEATRQDDGRCFETFRRIGVSALV